MEVLCHILIVFFDNPSSHYLINNLGQLLHKGKVRDIYEVDDKHLLIVTTDRLSAFDVVMSEPIPFKGFVLTQMADFWFNKLSFVVANHLSGIAPESVLAENEVIQVKNRAIVARKLKALPIEAKGGS